MKYYVKVIFLQLYIINIESDRESLYFLIKYK
nr:MAG TPA: hypothetical protein [Caudoviricetes sp.]